MKKTMTSQFATRRVILLGLRTVAALVSAAALLSCTNPAPDEPVSPFSSPATLAAGHPVDLSGIWELPEGAKRWFDDTAKTGAEQKPPLTPVWMAEWRKTRKRIADGMRVWDPNIRCLPPGMPRSMNLSYPVEILQTTGQVKMIFEYFNEIRTVWLDGRAHPGPDEIEPTFSGHSTGHWEGDTLVIDTVGLRHDSVTDLSMLPHSDQLHIVERLRRVGPDELELAITLEDPVVFEKPWSTVKRYVRSPPGSAIREYVCAESATTDPYFASPEDDKYNAPDPRLKTLP